MFASLIVFIMIAGSPAPTVAEPERTAETVDASKLSIDELIARVPCAGAEVRTINNGPEARTAPMWPAESTELRHRIMTEGLTNPQWQQVLLEKGVLQMRQDWPRNQELLLELRMPFWLGSAIEIRAHSTMNDSATIRAGRTWHGPCGLANADLSARAPKEVLVDRCGSLGHLAPDADSVDVEIEIRAGSDGSGSEYSQRFWNESKQVFTGKVRLPIRQVDGVDAAIASIRLDMIDEAVRSALTLRVFPHGWADQSIHANVDLLLDANSHPELQELAFGLRLELLRDAQLMDTIDISAFAIQSLNWDRSRRAWDGEIPSLLNQVHLLRDNDELARWQIRVRGDPRLALTAWKLNRCWAGEITMPLSKVLQRR